ncbi:hypothetical protein LCGC14_1301480 [marine sediment metagenome]|uniref:Uncharacterized protein n=1 Tax=marine sediment metagenome TaxID=412755 RepID=A0A0F9N621_9ZZZZ
MEIEEIKEKFRHMDAMIREALYFEKIKNKANNRIYKPLKEFEKFLNGIGEDNE